MKKTMLICIFLLSLVFGATRFATVTGAGSKNGSSWANAYEGLQPALSAAGNGDEVWVAAGTYYPSVEIQGTGDRYKTFQLKNGVAIYGGFAGTENAVSERSDFGLGGANETILSGNIGDPGLSNDNCYHVINHPDALLGIPGSTSLVSSAVLDGFTIRDGYADGPESNDRLGGGMALHRGDPTLRNLVLISNHAQNSGGGMYCYVSASQISNIRFLQNTTGGGNGGGLVIYRCNNGILFDQVEFTENTAGSGGGGVYFQESSAPAIRNARFFSNSAHSGGAVYINGSSATFVNALFVNNEANGTGMDEGEGGAMLIYNGSPQIVNATFTLNIADVYGGAIMSGGASSAPLFSNCILWNNNSNGYANEIALMTGSLTLDHSCYANVNYTDVYGSPSASDCININPQFAGASPNPYHIYGTSPCVDAGSDAANSQTYDIRGDGFPRKLNKSTGGAGTIDMGAYEYLVNTDYYDAEDVPLPICLASFSAEALNGAVSVTWVTESESENAHFLLYRDGAVIARIAGAGTSSEPHSYAYTDQYVVPGKTYTYQLADVSLDGEETKHNEVEVKVKAEYVDRDYNIGSAYPNPFNPVTVVPVNLAKDAAVRAQLYDITGRPLQELQNGTLSAGSHALTVNGANLSTGIYFVRIGINDQMHVQKIALMK